MVHFAITRDRYTVTAMCTTCLDTSGSTRTDRAVELWQRKHRGECGKDQQPRNGIAGRPRTPDSLNPSPTYPRAVNAPQNASTAPTTERTTP